VPHRWRTNEVFRDREEAGKQLGTALSRYKRTGSLVLGIPRGGAEVAWQVALALASEFSILVVRKLPFPDNPESGFGAIAEDGTVYLHPVAHRDVPRGLVERIVREQREEVLRRVRILRANRPLPDLRGRHVILVDDGIAMGSTTRAAVECCRNLGARRVIVAAPVASPHAIAALREVADEVVVLLAPPFFRAVAEIYAHWYDVPDTEVVAILEKAWSAGRPDHPPDATERVPPNS
jgi:putative phosphoribosyl transferase